MFQYANQVPILHWDSISFHLSHVSPLKVTCHFLCSKSDTFSNLSLSYQYMLSQLKWSKTICKPNKGPSWWHPQILPYFFTIPNMVVEVRDGCELQLFLPSGFRSDFIAAICLPFDRKNINWNIFCLVMLVGKKQILNQTTLLSPSNGFAICYWLICSRV